MTLVRPNLYVCSTDEIEIYCNQLFLSVNSDVATDKTTSHPTKQPEDGCQVFGYSHSTNLAKDASQVAGYVANWFFPVK